MHAVDESPCPIASPSASAANAVIQWDALCVYAESGDSPTANRGLQQQVKHVPAALGAPGRRNASSSLSDMSPECPDLRVRGASREDCGGVASSSPWPSLAPVRALTSAADTSRLWLSDCAAHAAVCRDAGERGERHHTIKERLEQEPMLFSLQV